MPYSGPNDKSLPTYVKNRSENIRRKWVSIFNAAYKKYGNDKKAFVIANTWLKKQNGKKFVKRSFITLETVSGKKFIKRDKDGNDYISFVLSSTTPHKDGRIFDEGTLKSWESYINKNPIVGDIDHKFYDYIQESGMSDDGIINMLKSKKGIAKSIKAIYKQGKLWVRAMIDKRYRKLINKSKGVSLEAVCDMEDNREKNWNLLGFTFNVNTEPADYSAGVFA